MAKSYVYYYLILIKEGIDLYITDPEKNDKSRNCSSCEQFFIIKKNSNLIRKFVRLTFTDESNKIFILWIDNCLYRAFTNLCMNYTNRFLREEQKLDKYGYIDLPKPKKLLDRLTQTVGAPYFL